MSTGCGTLANPASFHLSTEKAASAQQKMVEFYDTDSMIKNWTDTEIRRDAASGGHGVHAHNHIKQFTLPGSDRVSISGVPHLAAQPTPSRSKFAIASEFN
jgi:hypothetical protein